jgi:hypothetical protein
MLHVVQEKVEHGLAAAHAREAPPQRDDLPQCGLNAGRGGPRTIDR